jgi:hypothetical protein
MRDLAIHENDLIVATHGRSFWILDDITPLRQLADIRVDSQAYLFKPEDAYRVRRSTNPDTPIPPDEPAGKNPPDGAILDYFLAQPAAGAVILEITDAQGKVVRRFSSDDNPEITQADLEKQIIPLYWIRAQKILSASPGMHRWVWDLHYPAPKALQHEYPIAAVPNDTPRSPLGPLAIPGEYSARLSVNGHTFTQTFIVKLDPRVKVAPAAIEQQFTLEMRLASELTATTEGVNQARSIVDELHNIEGQAKGALADSIKALDQKVKITLHGPTPPVAGIPPEPNLTRESAAVGMLYGAIGQADAAPTTAQLNAAAETERELTAVMKRWDEIKTSDVPALNRQLKKANLQEISTETKQQNEDAGGDLE